MNAKKELPVQTSIYIYIDWIFRDWRKWLSTDKIFVRVTFSTCFKLMTYYSHARWQMWAKSRNTKSLVKMFKNHKECLPGPYNLRRSIRVRGIYELARMCCLFLVYKCMAAHCCVLCSCLHLLFTLFIMWLSHDHFIDHVTLAYKITTSCWMTYDSQLPVLLHFTFNVS